jgi:integrase
MRQEGNFMAVYKQKDSNNWWFKFTWNGKLIRESTKQCNKRVAEQMEAARKTGLAKGEVGIRDRPPIPSLKEFAGGKFLPYVRSHNASKPRTVAFYENSTKHLVGFSKMAKMRLDEIKLDVVAEFVAHRQLAKVQVSTINRDLATLRRMFSVALESLEFVPPKIKLRPGENRRERILTDDEEAAYLEAAARIGHDIELAYAKALTGIRATLRGEAPMKLDAYLLRDVATILIDAGLRPEECFRLRWVDNIREGCVYVLTGKTDAARRKIPLTYRALAILEMRRGVSDSPWVFPAPTKSGHIETSTLKKQHAAAIKTSKLTPFVLYTFRHTCITRWARKKKLFAVKMLAGHAELSTTSRYVHFDDEDMADTIDLQVSGGHSSRHSDPKYDTSNPGDFTVTN